MCDSKELRKREVGQALLPGVLAPPEPSPVERPRSARRARLSPKQKLFVEAYLQTLNGTEAARRAGYSDPNGNYAKRLLKMQKSGLKNILQK
jgi:hypothetical protein